MSKIVSNSLLNLLRKKAGVYQLQRAIRPLLITPYRTCSTAEKEKFSLPQKLHGIGQSVITEYSLLAAQYGPVNLGQGFSEVGVHESIANALADIAIDENYLLHQYTRSYGHLRLVQAISKLYSNLLCRELNPTTEIIITAGAYGALFSSIVGHVDVGDEVIIIEPFFSCYEVMVKMAGGIPRFIPLRPPINSEGCISSADWFLDKDELRNLFNPKTKMIILNTPQNPIGKVFNCQELQLIADLCVEWNVLCLSDEVYEWLVYDGVEHIRICTLPDMWERTITIGSAGKTFSLTGWRIGWAYGPSDFIKNLQIVHQTAVYACPTPLQEALARGFELEMTRLESEECYFRRMIALLLAKRNFMVKFLQDADMKPTIPDGGYFVLADWTHLESKIDICEEKDEYRDYKFTKWMIKNVGLLGIPPTAFYSRPHKFMGESFVRYCFAKKQENLEKASLLLEKFNAI